MIRWNIYSFTRVINDLSADSCARDADSTRDGHVLDSTALNLRFTLLLRPCHVRGVYIRDYPEIDRPVLWRSWSGSIFEIQRPKECILGAGCHEVRSCGGWMLNSYVYAPLTTKQMTGIGPILPHPKFHWARPNRILVGSHSRGFPPRPRVSAMNRRRWVPLSSRKRNGCIHARKAP